MKNRTITYHTNTGFATDVRQGLTANPKHLSSKYIYDERGDKLFQQIMDLPDYYLTNCEFDILKKHTTAIADQFNDANGFDLIELGAGDGKKTKVLLRYLLQKNYHFSYLPVDISQYILDELESSLKAELPKLKAELKQGMYAEVLQELASYNRRKKVILVLGSNIGNLNQEQAVSFLKQIQASMNPNDMLFMGFDQKKNPQQIMDAYNDATGITAAFNKNLLHRINNELGGNFVVDHFKHWETYNPETGTAKSYLVSKKAQQVRIEALGLEINFKAWESIHTEISQKYDDEMVAQLANEAGLCIKEYFTDDRNFYKNYVFTKK